MSDIVLVYPKTGMDIGSTIAPPHNLLCVAAPLDKAGYKVKIIDQRTDKDWDFQLFAELDDKPIFIGIPAMTGTQIKYAMKIAQIARYAGDTPIVWGGSHPTLLPEQVLDSGLADYVCLGETDETIVKIANDISKGKAKKIISNPLPDMEKLLSTPWHLIDVEQYIHADVYLKGGRNLDVGQTSRGCPFNCGFCSSASIRQRKWRAMSAEKSIDMIKEAVKKFSLTGIWLRDDEFYIDANRAARICEGIIPLNIKYYTSGTRVDVFNKVAEEQVELYERSGANTLKFGAESGCNRILRLMGKGITKEETLKANLKAKRHNITPAFALMLGFPTETFKEIEETIDMARQIREDNPQAQFETMATYTALPGTPMWNMALKYGLKPPKKLEEWADWNFDEYDLEGKRIPWFNKKDRQAIGNLCYLSMLSNALPNVIDSLANPVTSKLLRLAYILPQKYFQWRFFGKHYKHAWELDIVRELRHRMFYDGKKVIR
tara:strand:+ start:614 stop:2083 length:1470 start_codon:yes stop_codon:yes gene_type:complete